MRRRVGAVAAVIGLVAAVGVTGSAVAAKTKAFTETFLGAQISVKGTSYEYVYKVRSSLDGSGAAVQVGKRRKGSTAFPLSYSETNTTYFANGVSKTKDNFEVGKPNAKGISSITGTGRCIAGGTGVHKHEKCSYTFKGTNDLKTTISAVKVTGTATR